MYLDFLLFPESLARVSAIQPPMAAVSAVSDVSRAAAGPSFGAAYVREARPAGDAVSGLYGADARLRQGGRAGASSGLVLSGSEDESASSGISVDASVDEDLSDSDEDLLERLKARDSKVRQHEAAHVMAAGGQTAGMPTYVYQTGPDGRRYAIGGSVNIAVLSTGDSEETLRQARTARRAALATGEPSAADMGAVSRSNAILARERRRALSSYAAQAEERAFGFGVVL